VPFSFLLFPAVRPRISLPSTWDAANVEKEKGAKEKNPDRLGLRLRRARSSRETAGRAVAYPSRPEAGPAGSPRNTGTPRAEEGGGEGGKKKPTGGFPAIALKHLVFPNQTILLSRVLYWAVPTTISPLHTEGIQTPNTQRDRDKQGFHRTSTTVPLYTCRLPLASFITTT
jgi:hypothetical protein